MTVLFPNLIVENGRTFGLKRMSFQDEDFKMQEPEGSLSGTKQVQVRQVYDSEDVYRSIHMYECSQGDPSYELNFL